MAEISVQGESPALVPTSLAAALNEAPIGRFHMRALIASGLGFFTDAYDLFIIGIVSALLKGEWNLSSTEVSLVSSATLLAAFIGATVLGRVADIVGRRVVYRFVALVMVLGALGSALAPNLFWLVAARFVLGFGIGGDYPVSAVLMSEFSNRARRGRLVGLLFSMQALGLIVGPLVAMTLLGAGASVDIAWRTMLALGVIPAGAAIYLRGKIPESPRFSAEVQGNHDDAVQAALFITGDEAPPVRRTPFGRSKKMSLSAIVHTPRLLLLLVGTAGTWFAFDYAYYGNTISTPLVLRLVAPHSTMITKLAWTLLIFVVAALPGYLLAFAAMDRVGHRRLQWIGFSIMALAFGLIAAVPGIATGVVPFLCCYGLSYFFAEFGPNTTTFVLPSEIFPTGGRTTAHGISAGVAKLGAAVGVFSVPVLLQAAGLRGALGVAAGAAVFGGLLTLVLPEPAGRSLEDVAGIGDTPGLPGREIGTASVELFDENVLDFTVGAVEPGEVITG